MRRVRLVGLMALVAGMALAQAAQAAEGWRTVLEEGFDSGTLDPAQWNVFPRSGGTPGV